MENDLTLRYIYSHKKALMLKFKDTELMEI